MHWEYELPDAANTRAVHRVGQLLLVGLDDGQNGQFDIYDVSVPSDPVLQSSTAPGSPVVGMAVEGDYAYLALWSGIQVVDFSDPESPQVIGLLKPTRGSITT